MAKTIEAILEEIRNELKEAEDEKYILDIWVKDETMNFLLSNTKPTVNGRHLVLTNDFHQLRFKLDTCRIDALFGPEGSWQILEAEYRGEKIYEVKEMDYNAKKCHTI